MFFYSAILQNIKCTFKTPFPGAIQSPSPVKIPYNAFHYTPLQKVLQYVKTVIFLSFLDVQNVLFLAFDHFLLFFRHFKQNKRQRFVIYFLEFKTPFVHHLFPSKKPVPQIPSGIQSPDFFLFYLYPQKSIKPIQETR